jgi:hypothetical protein
MGVLNEWCSMSRLLFGIGSILVVLGVMASAQSRNEPSPNPLRAIVEIHLTKHEYIVGEEIVLSLILRPTGEGIYIANSWGEAGENIPGFRISLMTVDGKLAQSCGRGSVADYFADAATPAQQLVAEFMYLPANNFIGWETDVPISWLRHSA